MNMFHIVDRKMINRSINSLNVIGPTEAGFRVQSANHYTIGTFIGVKSTATLYVIIFVEMEK